MAKNTYGTGNFLLLNTGTTPIRSQNGLLTTVCYKIGDQDPVYALEGSIAVTGSLVQWVRDNLELISDASDIEKLAGQVDDNGGAYFVPAFSGLFAPYWRPDARGAILGLTRYVRKATSAPGGAGVGGLPDQGRGRGHERRRRHRDRPSSGSTAAWWATSC